eukprot:scaffold109930_cov61-Phaeocystis_antarctica.AAC.2
MTGLGLGSGSGFGFGPAAEHLACVPSVKVSRVHVSKLGGPPTALAPRSSSTAMPSAGCSHSK